MIGIHEILCTIIFKYINFYDKHTFKKIKKFMNRIHMTDLFGIDNKYLVRLDDNILSNYKFAVRLCARNNPKITHINHMTNLKELNAGGKCGIDNYGVKNINLEVLYAYDNQKITNIKHMTNLKELDARFNCGIDDYGVKNLNLEVLYQWNNPKIQNMKRMTNIKELAARKWFGIEDVYLEKNDNDDENTKSKKSDSRNSSKIITKIGQMLKKLIL